MKKLAIIGHPIEGDKIIEILKMLGGKNKDGDDGWKCKNPQLAFYIDDTGWIEFINTCNPNKNILRYTLEEFEEKFPYKVGDEVITRDKFIGTITDIRWQGDSFFVGKEEGDIVYTVQVSKTAQITYQKEDLQPYKEETIDKANKAVFDANAQCCDIMNHLIKEETMEEKEDKAKAPNLIGEDYYGKRFGYKIPNGYELDCIKNNEIILKPKQPQYPKTYEECCEVLGIEEDLWFVYEDIDGNHINPACISNYRIRNLDLYHNFEKLRICRDAYWKIAGEQMGLGKPWEPDFKDDSDKYFICYLKDEIWKSNIRDCNRFLVFPTEKIRDEFYENFKDSIKACKNLI